MRQRSRPFLLPGFTLSLEGSRSRARDFEACQSGIRWSAIETLRSGITVALGTRIGYSINSHLKQHSVTATVQLGPYFPATAKRRLRMPGKLPLKSVSLNG